MKNHPLSYVDFDSLLKEEIETGERGGILIIADRNYPEAKQILIKYFKSQILVDRLFPILNKKDVHEVIHKIRKEIVKYEREI